MRARACPSLQQWIFHGVKLPYPLPDFVTQVYGTATDFCELASEAMTKAGLGPEKAHGRLKRFLNRIFGLKIEMQTHVFDFFINLVRQSSRTLFRV